MANRDPEQMQFSKRIESRRARRERNLNRLLVGSTIAAGLIIAIFLIVESNTRNAAPAPVEAPAVTQERLDLDPIQGNSAAPVTIVGYGGYACEGCRSWFAGGFINQIINEFPGQVRFVYRDLPTTEFERMAASVAQCALDQSQDLFWAFHTTILEDSSTSSYSRDQLIELGGQVGLDVALLRACAEANTHLNTVEYDVQRAQADGFTVGPEFTVNDARVFRPSPQTLRAAVTQALP